MGLQTTNCNPISRVAKYRRNHSQPTSSKYVACISADDMDSGVTDTSYDPDSKVKSCKQKQKRLSALDIGKKLDIGEKTVRRMLRENGVRIRHSSEYVSKLE